MYECIIFNIREFFFLMCAGNGGLDVTGNDKVVGVSDWVEIVWEFIGVVLRATETCWETVISVSQHKSVNPYACVCVCVNYTATRDIFIYIHLAA